jgi:hypothetical protein
VREQVLSTLSIPCFGVKTTDTGKCIRYFSLTLKLWAQGSLAGLHEDLGTDVLPPEYGGTNTSVKELTGNIIKKK